MKQMRMALVALMCSFFAMGFVDLVGIASNYVKADLMLTDSEANLFTSMTFFWFLIFGVPSGLLMNKIGRKNTVMLSLVVTAISLALPIFGETYWLMFVSFGLLGIGNTLMQTSCNPLLSSIVSGDKLASSLTFGQFIKAIASFLAPYIAIWGATQVIPAGDFGWRILFVIYLVVSILALLLLVVTPIAEQKAEGKPSNVVDCFRLLSNPFVLICFLGIMAHVGIDVGVNTTAPKILIERLGMDLNEAAVAGSIYFAFRTLGCLSGSFILTRMSNKLFFGIGVALILGSMAILGTSSNLTLLYVAFGMAGYGNSNIFPILLANGLQSQPLKQNEVSGLMIMGIVGGAIFPAIMGVASDAMGQVGAVTVMAALAIYLVFATLKLKK